MANKFTKLNLGDSVASSGGRVFKKLSTVTTPTEQLPAPYGVTIDGNTLTWGDYSALATNFDILVDGVVSANTTEQSFPLSYFGFSDGTYSISVVSKAEGYLDSDPSEAVSYEVGGDSIVGTWVFNHNLYDVGSTSLKWKGLVQVPFSSGTYSNLEGMRIGNGTLSYCISVSQSKYVNNGASVYSSINGGTWKTSVYKTINILSDDVTTDTSEWSVDDFKAWLKANATKQ